MSRFGDNNLKSDIYENLNCLIGEEAMDQINFLHNTIIELATNGFEYVNEFIVESIKKRNLTLKEALEELGEIYSTIVGWDLISSDL